jgi:CDGSH-type Zn-finger protein
MNIVLRENGSIAIETDGAYTLQVGNAEPQRIEKARLSLCRCGHSAATPLCDSTHKTIGFSAPGATLEFNPPETSSL